MKLIRLALACVALGAGLGACEAGRVTTPDQPYTIQKRGEQTTNSTPPAPSDTTTRQVIGSGG